MTRIRVTKKTAAGLVLVIVALVSLFLAILIPRRTIQFDSDSLPSGVNKVLILDEKKSFSGAIHPDGNAYFGRGLWRLPWEPNTKQVKISSKSGVVMNSPVKFPVFGRFSIHAGTTDAPNTPAMASPIPF